jgi:hypothetical protein
MTLDEARSIHYTGDITAPSTQQHPSDPRHIHQQKARQDFKPTNLVSRIEISAGFDEQLHDQQMTF